MAAPAAGSGSNLMIFQWLMQNVEAILNHYIAATVNNVITAITPVAMTLFGIFVLLWGFAHFRNQIEEPVTDGLMRLIKVAIVLGIALNVSYYGMMVVNFVMQTPEHFLMAANGSGPMGGGSPIGQVLDDALNKGFNVGQKAWDKGGLGNIGYLFAALIIWISVVLVLLFAAGLVILSKIATVVLLAMGPVFILLVLFKGTQRFFELWMGQLVNFMMTLVLAVLMTTMVIAVVGGFLDDQMANASGATVVLVQVMAVGGVGILVLRQVPQVASAIAGGIGLSTMGTYGATMRGGWNKGSMKGTRDAAARQRDFARATKYNRGRAAVGQATKTAATRAKAGAATAFRRQNPHSIRKA